VVFLVENVHFVGRVVKSGLRLSVNVPAAYRDLFPKGCRVVVRSLVVEEEKKAGELK